TVYAQAGLLTGRKATCYPALLDVLDEHGADVSEEKVVIDGHFVTSRGLGTAMSFGLTLTKVLTSQEKAEEVRADIVSTDEIF
ncbi:MAG: DJ-1/PfpI family protein, partial [Lachnospiraceae bacterium]|nr:DJ-1/PfpI family protein [Lachnospiraceae bacterium]